MSKAPVQRKHNNDATKGTDTELSTAVAGGDESLTVKTDDDSLDQNLDGDDSKLGVTHRHPRFLVGDYPFYTAPISDTDPCVKKPRPYHLVVDLVYSAMLGKAANWLAIRPAPSKCSFGDTEFGCNTMAFFFGLTMLFHWWRLNLHLVWYDNKQSIFTDIFLVGDNICMLGITAVLNDRSVTEKTLDDDIHSVLLLYVIACGTAFCFDLPAWLLLTALQIPAVALPGLLWIQQVHQLYVNRKRAAAFHSFRYYCWAHSPGFVFRFIWMIVMCTGNMTDGIAKWNWILYGVLLDTAAPWIYGVVHVKAWNKGPSEWLKGGAHWLHISIEFVDARVGRIMTIVVALLLTSGVAPNWSQLSHACRFRVVVLPALLVFSYLPYMVTFDRDPKTEISQHAMSHSFWTSILYTQAASLMPTLVVLMSANFQRLWLDNPTCGTVSASEFVNEDRWILLTLHAIMVLVAAFRFLLHKKNPKSTPRWTRKVRIACRCAAAFLPLVLSAERYGRVTLEEVNQMVESHPKSTPPKKEAHSSKADSIELDVGVGSMGEAPASDKGQQRI